MRVIAAKFGTLRFLVIALFIHQDHLDLMNGAALAFHLQLFSERRWLLHNIDSEEQTQGRKSILLCVMFSFL